MTKKTNNRRRKKKTKNQFSRSLRLKKLKCNKNSQKNNSFSVSTIMEQHHNYSNLVVRTIKRHLKSFINPRNPKISPLTKISNTTEIKMLVMAIDQIANPKNTNKIKTKLNNDRIYKDEASSNSHCIQIIPNHSLGLKIKAIKETFRINILTIKTATFHSTNTKIVANNNIMKTPMLTINTAITKIRKITVKNNIMNTIHINSSSRIIIMGSRISNHRQTVISLFLNHTMKTKFTSSKFPRMSTTHQTVIKPINSTALLTMTLGLREILFHNKMIRVLVLKAPYSCIRIQLRSNR